MRACVLGFGLLLAAVASAEADYLRGAVDDELAPPSYTRWEGVYVGGTAGYNTSGSDFSEALREPIAYILRESALENMGRVSQWDILGRQDTSGTSYGAFIGYNRQWDDAIVGVELAYNRTSLPNAMSGSLGRILSPGDGYTYDTEIIGSASVNVKDYGTLRLRGGYAFGRVMPYAMLGLAVARAEVNRSVTVAADVTQGGAGPTVFFRPAPYSESKTEYLFGYGGGLGLDVALTNNIFVRAEWEYIQFGLQNDIRTNINAFRGGAGLKF